MRTSLSRVVRCLEDRLRMGSRALCAFPGGCWTASSQLFTSSGLAGVSGLGVSVRFLHLSFFALSRASLAFWMRLGLDASRGGGVGGARGGGVGGARGAVKVVVVGGSMGGGGGTAAVIIE